jgi:AhpC/TSA family
MRRFLLAMPVLTLGLVAGCSWLHSRQPSTGQTPVAHVAEVGQVAPDLDGEEINGGRLHLADYRGKVVVLHFWADS